MTDEQRCRTCRWWDEEQNCLLSCSIKSRAEYGWTKAVAFDGANFLAWLKTAPDFGCVQWEAKDED